MIFPFLSQNGIQFDIIVKFLDKEEQIKIININNTFYRYFYKNTIAIYIYYYLTLIKLQKKRPAQPHIFNTMCGIEWFIPKIKLNTIMDNYHNSKNILNIYHNKFCLTKDKYSINSLLLENIKYNQLNQIYNHQNIIIPDNITDIKISMFNYQSLGLSHKKNIIFSNDGHFWPYFKITDFSLSIQSYYNYLNKHFNNADIELRYYDALMSVKNKIIPISKNDMYYNYFDWCIYKKWQLKNINYGL